MPISRKKKTRSRKTQNKRKSVKKSVKRNTKKSVKRNIKRSAKKSAKRKNTKKSVKRSNKTRRLTYNLGFHRIPHGNKGLNEICSDEKKFIENFIEYKKICPKLNVLDITSIPPPPYIENGELNMSIDQIEYYNNLFENSQKCVPLREKTSMCFKGVEKNPLYTIEEKDDVKGHNTALSYIKKWIQKNNEKYNSLKTAVNTHRMLQIHKEKAKAKKIEKKEEEKKKIEKQKKGFSVLMEEDY